MIAQYFPVIETWLGAGVPIEWKMGSVQPLDLPKLAYPCLKGSETNQHADLLTKECECHSIFISYNTHEIFRAERKLKRFGKLCGRGEIWTWVSSILTTGLFCLSPHSHTFVLFLITEDDTQACSIYGSKHSNSQGERKVESPESFLVQEDKLPFKPLSESWWHLVGKVFKSKSAVLLPEGLFVSWIKMIKARV